MHLQIRKALAAYPPIVWWLGVGSFINVGGLSLLWPVNSIYIHLVLHKPLTVAGLVLMLYSGAGFVGSFLGGWLHDRMGPVPVLTLGLSVAACTILVPLVFPDWTTYVAVMIVFGTACAMPFPVMNASVGLAWPEAGRRAFNFIYVASNLGVATGTAIGGALAQWSFHAVFCGIAASYTLYLALVWGVLRKKLASARQLKSIPAQPDAAAAAGTLPVTPWLPLIVLLTGYMCAWAIYVQWQSTVSVYMRALGYSLTSYSVLWTLNGLLIFVSQPVMAAVLRKVRNLIWHMLLGSCLYAIAYAVLWLSRAYPAFVCAMVVLTAGELFLWPSVPAVVAKLAPSHRMGLLQGLTGSAATLGRMVGPLAGGLMYDHMPMREMLHVVVLAIMLPLSSFWLFGRLARLNGGGVSSVRSPSA